MVPITASNQIRMIARRARLSSANGQPLELHLSPQESEILARALEELLADEQAWFWSEAWQAGEQEAEADLAAGRYEDFDEMEEMLRDLGWQEG